MTTVADTAAPRIAGSLVLAARQFPRHRAAMVGLVVLALICLAAILAPLVAPYDPIQIKLSAKLKPPSLEHWLGTDHFGRDILSRLLYGGRTSLTVGLLVVGFAFALGVPLGLASGYFGGRGLLRRRLRQCAAPARPRARDGRGSRIRTRRQAGFGSRLLVLPA